MGHLPVLCVVEESLLRQNGKFGDDKACDESTDDGNAERDEECGRLVSSLDTSSAKVGLASRFKDVLDVSAVDNVARHRRRHRAADAANDAGKTVKVAHAARVLDTKLGLEHRGHVNVSRNTNESRNHADERSSPRLDDEIGG